MKLSIVVPCFNEEESLPEFWKEASAVTDKLNASTEYIFVDDGSHDETVSILKKLEIENKGKVSWLSFSRNFGKEAAIYAGLQYASGDYAVIMDADLQDPPEMIPRMLNYVTSGDWDCAAAYRVSRKGEPPVKSWFSNKFYDVSNKICEVQIRSGARDFRMMSRQMVNAILADDERCRFSKGIFPWVGFRTIWIGYENVERKAGTTKWNFTKLAKYAVDGLLAYSTVPLDAVSITGAASVPACGAALLLGAAGVLPAAPALLGAGIFMLSAQNGVQTAYLKRIYKEVKHRPIYIVREAGGFGDSHVFDFDDDWDRS